MVPLIDLILPKQKLLVKQVKATCEVYRLLGELSREEVRQEDNLCFSLREVTLAHQTADVLDNICGQFRIEIALLLPGKEASCTNLFLALHVK